MYNPPHQSHRLAQRLDIVIQTSHMSLRGVYSPYPSPAPPAPPFYVRRSSWELVGAPPELVGARRSRPVCPRGPQGRPHALPERPRPPKGPPQGDPKGPQRLPRALRDPSRAPRAPMKTSHGTAATATLRPPGPPGERPDAPTTSRWTLPGPLKDPQGAHKDPQGVPQ